MSLNYSHETIMCTTTTSVSEYAARLVNSVLRTSEYNTGILEGSVFSVSIEAGDYQYVLFGSFDRNIAAEWMVKYAQENGFKFHSLGYNNQAFKRNPNEALTFQRSI